LRERGINVSHDTFSVRVYRFRTCFANRIRKRRSEPMRRLNQWRWHLGEVLVNIYSERTTSCALLMIMESV
jgi:transposase-like protein